MKNFILILTVMLVAFFSCEQAESEKPADKSDTDQISLLETNKAISATYHELKAENIDLLFTDDFKGSGHNGSTWDREKHRNYLSAESYKKDSVIMQIAEGDYVMTWFERTSDYKGHTIKGKAMMVKKISDGKISEVTEYWEMDWSEYMKKFDLPEE